LVGRPNVGKSTLFNRLTRSRKALVADSPGLTRDRRYGVAYIAGNRCTLIDTGGMFGDAGDLQIEMDNQSAQALAECDEVLFLVDARDGLVSLDEEIAHRLRKLGKPIILVVNKIDGSREDAAVAEFSKLGFKKTTYISASHGKGLNSLEFAIFDDFSVQHEVQEIADKGAIKVALIGRPNVGKSTLANTILGEERVVVFDGPGTTRDSIDIPFEGDSGQPYVLIDTAGVRRKGRVTGVAEKFSVVDALEAMEEANVVILLVDANEGVVDQDLHILGYAMDAGCGILVAVNKWDGLSSSKKEIAKKSVERKLRFIPWIAVTYVSALHGTGTADLLTIVDKIYVGGQLNVSPSELTNILSQIVLSHPPPSIRGRMVKLRYAHKAGEHPPKIMIHGNQTNDLPKNYVRYLENSFRDALGLWGNPVVISLQTGENPYASKRNALSQRQLKRRSRLIAHRKKRARG